MSAISIVIQKLAQDSRIIAVVGTKVFSGRVPQKAAAPYLRVYLASEIDPQLLVASAKYPESRVTVESDAVSDADADALGEIVKLVLQDTINETITDGESPPTIHGVGVNITRADTDFTDYDDQRGYGRRVTDYYVRWKSPPA